MKKMICTAISIALFFLLTSAAAEVSAATTEWYSQSVPGIYDPRLLGLTTPVGNQGSNDSSWAFSANAMLEGNLINTTGRFYNFSEEHMRFYSSNDSLITSLGLGHTNLSPDAGTASHSTGRVSWRSAGYLTNWFGAVSEEEVPYNMSNGGSWDAAKRDKTPQKRVTGYKYLPNDTNVIKAAIKNFGAVETTMFINADRQSAAFTDWYNRENYAYAYLGADNPVNYSVAIVGWDDNFRKALFNPLHPPSENGAWLVKCSFGKGFGAGGYIWVSYEDSLISFYNNYKYSVITETVNYNPRVNMKSYDRTGVISFENKLIGNGENIVFCNTYNLDAGHTITDVMTFSENLNVNYKVFVFKYNAASNGRPTGSNETAWGGARAQGTTDSMRGYFTIKLDAPYTVPAGQGGRYCVAVMYSGLTDASDNNLYKLPVADIPSYVTQPLSVNESFVFSENSWTDSSRFYVVRPIVMTQGTENNSTVSSNSLTSFYGNDGVFFYMNFNGNFLSSLKLNGNLLFEGERLDYSYWGGEEATINSSALQKDNIWPKQLVVEFSAGNNQTVSIDVLRGDVNKDNVVNAEDAVAIKKYLLGIEPLDSYSTVCADYDNDKSVCIADLTSIVKSLA